MLRTVIFDSITGEKLNPVEPSGGSWSAKLDGSGSNQFTVPVLSMDMSRTARRDLLRPNARLVAHIDEFDTVIAAGMLLRTPYSITKTAATCYWVDIRDLFRQRMGFGVGSWNSTGTLQVTNRSYSGAARAIVSRQLRDFTQPTWMLPIDLPADGAGTFSRKWDYYQFPTMDDCLRELEKEGVEIYFDPYLTSGGNLRFATRVGTPITGASFDLPVSAEGSHVENLEADEDGSKQLTGVLYAGNGTDADTVTAWAGGGQFTIPIRDAYRSAKGVKSIAQLQRMADADLAEHKDPIEQWSFDVRVDEPVRASHVKPGRLLRMDVRDDPWLPDGVTTQRVIGVSGDLASQTYQLEVQSHG